MGATLAGYAACLQVLSALPSRPNRPDRWGRFGLGAFLNAGKNGGAFHRRDNGLADNLGKLPRRGVKIGKPFSGNSLAKQNRLFPYAVSIRDTSNTTSSAITQPSLARTERIILVRVSSVNVMTVWLVLPGSSSFSKS